MTLAVEEENNIRQIRQLASVLEASDNMLVRDFAATVLSETRAALIHAVGSDSRSLAMVSHGVVDDPAAEAYPADRYTTYVPLSCTDAFAVLYWGAPVIWAQTGYENLMRAVGHPLEEMLGLEWDIPVVHTEIDYHLPLHLGDRIEVETRVTEVGNRSVRMETRVLREGMLALRLMRIHVSARRAGGPAPLPDWLRKLGPARLSKNSRT